MPVMLILSYTRIYHVKSEMGVPEVSARRFPGGLFQSITSQDASQHQKIWHRLEWQADIECVLGLQVLL